MTVIDTDRIEKEIVLRAPRARVWREELADGTRLKITESGFDRVPLARRAEAFRMSSEGWAEQAENIARYLGQAG